MIELTRVVFFSEKKSDTGYLIEKRDGNSGREREGRGFAHPRYLRMDTFIGYVKDKNIRYIPAESGFECKGEKK